MQILKNIRLNLKNALIYGFLALLVLCAFAVVFNFNKTEVYADSYTITYKADFMNQDGEMSSTSVSSDVNGEFTTLGASTFSRKGFKLVGWYSVEVSEPPVGEEGGEVKETIIDYEFDTVYKIDKNIELLAKWQMIDEPICELTVEFSKNQEENLQHSLQLQTNLLDGTYEGIDSESTLIDWQKYDENADVWLTVLSRDKVFYFDEEITNNGQYRVVLTYVLNGNDEFECISNIVTVEINETSLQPDIENFMGNYDGNEHSISVNVDEQTEVLYSLNNSEWDSVLPTFSLPGTYSIFVSVNKGSTYNFESESGIAQINKYSAHTKEYFVEILQPTLTVKVNGQTIYFGDEPEQFSVNYEGFIVGDDENNLSGKLVFECDYEAGMPVGNYQIKVSGLSSDIYKIEYVNGLLQVISASEKLWQLSGIILNENDVPVEGANVSLELNKENITSTITNSNGEFIIPDISNNKYIIRVEKDNASIFKTVFVNGSNVEDIKICLSSKNIKIDYITETEIDFEIDGLEQILTDEIVFNNEINQSILDGSNAEIVFSLNSVDEDNYFVTQLNESATTNNKKLTNFIDINITMSLSNKTEQINVTSLTNPLCFTIPLSEKLQEKTGVVLYRFHNNEIQILTQEENADGERFSLSEDGSTVTIYSNKFSIYSLGYDFNISPTETGEQLTGEQIFIIWCIIVLVAICVISGYSGILVTVNQKSRNHSHNTNVVKNQSTTETLSNKLQTKEQKRAEKLAKKQEKILSKLNSSQTQEQPNLTNQQNVQNNNENSDFNK